MLGNWIVSCDSLIYLSLSSLSFRVKVGVCSWPTDSAEVDELKSSGDSKDSSSHRRRRGTRQDALGAGAASHFLCASGQQVQRTVTSSAALAAVSRTRNGSSKAASSSPLSNDENKVETSSSSVSSIASTAEFEALASVVHEDSEGIRTLSLPRLALVQAAATSDLSRQLEQLEKSLTERLSSAEARAMALEGSLQEAHLALKVCA